MTPNALRNLLFVAKQMKDITTNKSYSHENLCLMLNFKDNEFLEMADSLEKLLLSKLGI